MNVVRHAVDIALCIVLLRITLGLLFRYKHLLRMLLSLAAIGLLVAGIRAISLPFSSILATLLAIPAAIIIVLNSLPELMRIYKARRTGQLLPTRSQAHGVIRAVGLTARELSTARTGAILVFPQQDDIENLIHGGEALDATVSASLLRSIFNPKAPRHDGAVIIRGDRIVRMGAVLPLAASDGVDPSWGTRHLAALGLSQRCDADVVVISEERGTISHMKAGAAKTIAPDDESLAALVRVIYQRVGFKKDPWRDRWRGVTLWAVSAAIAVFGSFYANTVKEKYFGGEAGIVAVEAPIVFANVPEGLVVEGLAATSCQLQLRAADTLFDNTPDVRIVIDLEGLGRGHHTRQVTPETVSGLPAQWRIERVYPSVIRFALAQPRD